MMLAGKLDGEAFSGIGYIGFDNVTKLYEATWMDTGSTGMTWYKGVRRLRQVGDDEGVGSRHLDRQADTSRVADEYLR